MALSRCQALRARNTGRPTWSVAIAPRLRSAKVRIIRSEGASSQRGRMDARGLESNRNLILAAYPVGEDIELQGVP